MELGYFFCGDLLGFSNIVKNLTGDDLDNKITSWTTLVKNAAETHNIQNFQLLSDTVFAVVGKEKTDLKNLINFARELLDKGIHLSLPIRGAISKGNYIWGQLVYGEAVVKAHELENRQNWIGVTLDSSVQLTENDFTDLGAVAYPAPMHSNSLIQMCNVITWSVPNSNELVKILLAGGLALKTEYLRWSWGDKLGNTVLFRIYLKILKDKNLPPHVFNDAHPINLIDSIVTDE